MEEHLKKNILDLHFQKYLVVASTSVIVAFTYLIGVSIAFITKQIRLDDIAVRSTLFIFSVAVLGLCAFFFFKALFHIRNIPVILKNLKLK